MPTTIDSSFIGSFKLGDNINYNLSILAVLYAARDGAVLYQRGLYRKPITLLNISILEAVLYDFHLRAKTFTREGIQNVATNILDQIRSKKIDELEKYIASARKHDLFDLAGTCFYDCLDQLRKIRNRVHIQNTKNHFEADDIAAFNEERLVLSQQALEQVMRTMAEKYRRAPDKKYVRDFVLPWDTHFPAAAP